MGYFRVTLQLQHVTCLLSVCAALSLIIYYVCTLPGHTMHAFTAFYDSSQKKCIELTFYNYKCLENIYKHESVVKLVLVVRFFSMEFADRRLLLSAVRLPVYNPVPG